MPMFIFSHIFTDAAFGMVLFLNLSNPAAPSPRNSIPRYSPGCHLRFDSRAARRYNGAIMEQVNLFRLVDTVMSIAHTLLQNGAEIYRVEDSAQRVAFAYGAAEASVFAVPNSLIITVALPDGKTFTSSKRVHSRQTNMQRIEDVNQLCRDICAQELSFDEVESMLIAINRRPKYKMWQQASAYGIVAASFALFFGGTALDALFALPIGVCMRLLLNRLEQKKVNLFFQHVAGSGLAGLMAYTLSMLMPALHGDTMITGAIMNLAPGVALTNAVRDIIAGDLIAGQSRLTEVFLTATAMALGAGIALSVLRAIWGV